MEYFFDVFSLWVGRLVFGGAILMALAYFGIAVANLSLFIFKLLKDNNRQATKR